MTARIALCLLLALAWAATPGAAQHRTAAPWTPAERLDSVPRPELSGGRYAGMAAVGTLGSAAGLLGGFLAAGAAYLGA